MVYFNDKKHEYFNDAGNKYLSVTTFIKQFKNAYDEEYWLTYKAIEAILNGLKIDPKTGKYAKMPGFYKTYGHIESAEGLMFILGEHQTGLFNEIKAKLKDGWKDNALTATDFGTAYHKMHEDTDLKNGESLNYYDMTLYKVIPNDPCIYDNCSQSTFREGCYLELLIYNNAAMIAGQSDKIFFVGDNKFDVADFKTNGKLEMTSFKNRKMLPPFEELDDCTYNHYAIQLGIYAYMLELQGFECRSLIIYHYDTAYQLKYYKNLIDKAFQLRRLDVSLPY